MKQRFLVLAALVLLLALILGSAPVSAQDPQPPWQGKLIAQAEMFRFNPGTNSMALEAVLPPNDSSPTSMVGVYGLNSHWVSLSAFNHVVAASLVQFPAGTNLSVDPQPLWQGTALQNCTIYTLGESHTLEPIGTLPTVGGSVGVYATGDGYAQISAWLHFVAADCLSGSFSQQTTVTQSEIPTPASFQSGVTVRTVTIEESLKYSCDEVHEIEAIQFMEDDSILVICKSPEVNIGGGGQVLLYGLGTVLTLASPIPGDEALVISAWVANAAKAGAVAVGVAASVASQASSTPLGAVQVGQDGYIPVSSDHHTAHNVVPGTAQHDMARQVLTEYAKHQNGGNGQTPEPPGNFRCVLMMVGDVVTRVITWRLTSVNPVSGVPKGDLVWWHTSSPWNGGGPEWGGAYPGKSGQTLTNLPKDLEGIQGLRMQECGPGNMPPPPALP